MAVIMASPTRSSAALVNYVLAEKKDQQGERYVMASGVGGLLVSVADKQMRDRSEERRVGKECPV